MVAGAWTLAAVSTLSCESRNGSDPVLGAARAEDTLSSAIRLSSQAEGPLEHSCDIGRTWIFPRNFSINLVIEIRIDTRLN